MARFARAILQNGLGASFVLTSEMRIILQTSERSRARFHKLHLISTSLHTRQFQFLVKEYGHSLLRIKKNKCNMESR